MKISSLRVYRYSKIKTIAKQKLTARTKSIPKKERQEKRSAVEEGKGGGEEG
jgi:hypothetical protein